MGADAMLGGVAAVSPRLVEPAAPHNMSPMHALHQYHFQQQLPQHQLLLPHGLNILHGHGFPPVLAGSPLVQRPAPAPAAGDMDVAAASDSGDDAATSTRGPRRRRPPAHPPDQAARPGWDRLTPADVALLADPTLTAADRRLIRQSITARNRRRNSAAPAPLAAPAAAASSVSASVTPGGDTAPGGHTSAGAAQDAAKQPSPPLLRAPPSAQETLASISAAGDTSFSVPPLTVNTIAVPAARMPAGWAPPPRLAPSKLSLAAALLDRFGDPHSQPPAIPRAVQPDPQARRSAPPAPLAPLPLVRSKSYDWPLDAALAALSIAADDHDAAADDAHTPVTAWIASRRLREDATGSRTHSPCPPPATLEEQILARDMLIVLMQLDDSSSYIM
ncbi:hypothetical protein HK105_207917 [Polyrhizophydium stewartii]|uniref:Uncharacterized protein n=1 Tax=Polyrhizophydium stewartii TaxID=2732419 RepID=A0ABR4MZD3_9FUNG